MEKKYLNTVEVEHLKIYMILLNNMLAMMNCNLVFYVQFVLGVFEFFIFIPD
jgi:hypothetical protein